MIASTHRAHGHTLAKGTPPEAIMAELYGKKEGCSHGFGGSMHLYDVERGNMGANAVVGGGIPAIVGAALAFKLRGEPRVGVAFFGDGATNIGTFYEALTLAQLWQVPALFVCANIRWRSPCPRPQFPIEDLTQRAAASDGVPSAWTARTWRRSTRELCERSSGCGEGTPILSPLLTRTACTATTSATLQVYRSKEDIAPRARARPARSARVRSSFLSDEELDALKRGDPRDRPAARRVSEDRHRPAYPGVALKYVYA